MMSYTQTMFIDLYKPFVHTQISPDAFVRVILIRTAALGTRRGLLTDPHKSFICLYLWFLYYLFYSTQPSFTSSDTHVECVSSLHQRYCIPSPRKNLERLENGLGNVSLHASGEGARVFNWVEWRGQGRQSLLHIELRPWAPLNI